LPGRRLLLASDRDIHVPSHVDGALLSGVARGMVRYRMSISNSPLCRITWTDVVHGTQHNSFLENDPLQLRFGLEFDPAFWSSFQTSQFFLWFVVSHFGNVLERHQQDGDTMSLPGAQSTKLWLGLQFGVATDATTNLIGLFQFRPEIWFRRQGAAVNLLSEFATVSNDHSFAIELGGTAEFPGPEIGLVGGSGAAPTP
jgi:hypothetical protein